MLSLDQLFGVRYRKNPDCKMPTLLNEATHKSAWSVSAPTAAKSMHVAYPRPNGEQALLQLTPAKELGSITVPWEPNVFNGSGDEPRKTISFSIPDETRQQIELIEETIREALRASNPNIDSVWNSSTKPPAKHSSLLRAKITVLGDKACKCFNESREPVQLPEDWAGLPVVPIIAVKSVYIQKSMAGLVLEVVSLLIGTKTATESFDVGFFL